MNACRLLSSVIERSESISLIRKGKAMEVSLTLLIQQVISAEDNDDYEEQRDALIQELETRGFAVNVEDESGDEFDDDFESYDEYDEYDDEEDDDEDEW